MALAILKHLKNAGGQHVFEVDIGTNNYYQYKIGKAKRKYRGLALVDEVSHQSSLTKAPVHNGRSFNTQFLLEIPGNLLNRDDRFVQLMSFKSQNRKSPAISEVVTAVPSLVDLNDDFKLPKIMMPSQTHAYSQEIAAKHAPCNIRQNKVSEAMFFNAILGALPNLLSNALPMIGKILPGLQKAMPVVEQVAGTAGKILPELGKIIPSDVKPGQEGVNQVMQNISPETLKAILEVIQGQKAHANGAGNGKAEAKSLQRFSHDFAINPAMLMQLAPLLEKVLSPETIKAIGDNPVKLFKAVSDSALKLQKMELDHLEKINPGVDDAGFDKIVQGMQARRKERLSEAKVAPALLAALPALMPVLEKVLSPDMIKAIGEQPLKLFNAIADAGLKHTQQELQHLEKINPGVDDPSFDNIVNSMSVKSAVSVEAKFSDAYDIEFINAQTIPVGGKEKVVYDRRQKIHIPVKILAAKKSDAQAQIPKGIFQLIIQDGDTMEVLLEKKFKLKNVLPGNPTAEIALDSGELTGLPLHKDLKIELSFNWKKEDTVEGTFKNHYICLSDGYLYQRIGNNITQHFALNDVTKFRNYWHKVWEGGPTTHERWKIEFECKYFYSVNYENANIKKLATKKQTVSDTATQPDQDDYRRKISAKLKTGMEISLEAYNELLKQYQLTPLNAAQLSAFAGQDFQREASTAARVSVDFKGRKGETSTLWTYPEGNIQSYVLSKAMNVDPSGMIVEVQEEEVYLPKFSSVHFIGTKSQ